VIAGYGGSGMFHALLSERRPSIIAVSHTGYHVWNEKAIAAYRDCPISVIRGVPDVTGEHFSKAVMHSDYHLDLSGPAGRVLHRVLQKIS